MLKNLLLLIVSLLVGLITVEVGLRVFYPQAVMPRYMIDSGFGVRIPAANKAYRHTVPGDYSVAISTNDLSMRGTTRYDLEPKSGIRRICLLGDSFVFGYGVDDADVVSEVLQRSLSDSNDGPQAYEVLNFGVSGYGQAEQLDLWINRVRDYRCHIVVAFYYSNDPGNNRVSSLYKLDADGRLVRDREAYLPGIKIQSLLYGSPILGDLIAHSHLWSLVRNAGSQLIHASMLKKKGLKTYSAEGDDSATSLTVALIRELKRSVEESGAQFAIFLIPAISRSSDTLGTNYPLEELSDVDSVLIDGRQTMVPEDYHRIDTHWNRSGHQKAAETLSGLVANDG